MEPFDWQRLFLGDHPLNYLFEIFFRSAVMYLVLIVFFKITGKKGIRQLSAFDFILIIGLGSASGDPMFMEDIPLLHAVAVFATVLGIYLIINKVTQRSHKADVLLEGETACVLEEGVINYDELMKEGLTLMQFFSEVRQHQVSHLGQVRRAFIEISGETSVFLFEDEDVKPGLPLFPEELKKPVKQIEEPGYYSCVRCGFTEQFSAPQRLTACPKCTCPDRVKSWTETRVA